MFTFWGVNWLAVAITVAVVFGFLWMDRWYTKWLQKPPPDPKDIEIWRLRTALGRAYVLNSYGVLLPPPYIRLNDDKALRRWYEHDGLPDELWASLRAGYDNEGYDSEGVWWLADPIERP